MSGSSGSGKDDFSISSLVVRALGKYPVPLRIRGTIFWPMAGLGWSRCLDGKIAGASFDNQLKDDLSEISILAGIALEHKISPAIYLRPSVILGYSLTSKRNPDSYTGATYVSSSVWLVEINLGIGYLL